MSSQTANRPIDLRPIMEMEVGQPLEYFRTVPIRLGEGQPRAFLTVYSADFDIDSGYKMFSFPTDTLKMMVYTDKGEILWRRDFGPGVVPGTCFTNFFAFDLDGDGVEEIWFVNNLDTIHPFNLYEYVLERINPLTGEATGQWPWPNNNPNQSPSLAFRQHIFAGYANGEPVLITAQGTYGPTYIQAWNVDMTYRWTKSIIPGEDGPQGSHVFPVVDINKDGIDEFMWGERCISVDTGDEIFRCDGVDCWSGHSDMIQPILNPADGRWYIYINREKLEDQGPRVLLYDDQGNRVWGQVAAGHIHKGWIGRIGPNGEMIATAGEIGAQARDLQGRYYTGIKEYSFDAWSGDPVQLPYSTFDTAPIDLNGDGFHEIVYGVSAGNARVIDRFGNPIKELGGRIVMASKIIDHPGEQLLVYHKSGKVQIWGDVNAQDTPEALERYANPFYKFNQKYPTKDYVMCMLGGV
ncbi:hypothetical protein [Paenibacillus radicis (ex Xue et al. 2023)]|uniref:FG-GAP repeat protein n=1 Tax=Paenibacillus radicis (ex Xue et al. 2023) TaxID=2972489 RepID=A0ABT1YDX7_9BACL|nr:hypothetical protein [Paenibacillus radicis (ex Xue et al. 2023)]MCR8631387.1 hypothetical protein [Paenibacillus radicis (ex Xue et al. 2023)]